MAVDRCPAPVEKTALVGGEGVDKRWTAMGRRAGSTERSPACPPP